MTSGLGNKPTSSSIAGALVVMRGVVVVVMVVVHRGLDGGRHV